MRWDDDIDCASRSVLFASMPQDLRELLIEQSVVRNHPRGASLFLQGEPAQHVFVVLRGWVKLFRIAQTGSEAIVGIFTRGQSFAEAVAFGDAVYPVNAEAVTDCRLLQLRASLVVEMLMHRPEIARAMLSATFLHLRQLVEQIEQLKGQTGAQRVAEFLLQLCDVGTGGCTVTLPYDKTLIAGRLGIKPESLSRAFTRLRDTGVQIDQNHALIADVARLRDFVEQDRADFWRRAQ